MQFATTSAALAHRNIKSHQDKLVVFRERWCKELRQSQQADAWGQVVEAVDGYNKLVSGIRSAIQDHIFTADEQDFMHSLIAAAHSRSLFLGNVTMDESVKCPTKEQLALINPAMSRLFAATTSQFTSTASVHTAAEFPFSVEGMATPVKPLVRKGGCHVITTNDDGDDKIEESKSSIDEQVYDMHESEAADLTIADSTTLVAIPEVISGHQGSLLPQAIHTRVEDAFVSITVDRIELQDCETYIDSFLRVTVFDNDRDMIESCQETPCARARGHQHMMIGHTIHIQTPIFALAARECRIVIEFVHWKPKKRKFSTRCWSVFHCSDILTGSAQMELYAKPVNLKRKIPLPYSRKRQLFLHSEVNVRPHPAMGNLINHSA